MILCITLRSPCVWKLIQVNIKLLIYPEFTWMIIHVRNDDYDITRQLRSRILWTNILLRTFSKCSIELRITYNNALRRLFNLHPRCSASAMFAYSHMPSLDEIRRKYMYRFIQRHNCTENLILLCFMSSTNMLTSSIWRQWYRCLYV